MWKRCFSVTGAIVPRGVALCVAAVFNTLLLALPVVAQSNRPADYGHIGLYADPTGDVTCASIPEGDFAWLYVLATPNGPTEDGITGAEFRVEVRRSEGWRFSFQPALGAILLGSPIDVHPGDPADDSGANIAFPSCARPDPRTHKVLLGRILVVNRGGFPTDLWLKRHTVPKNRSYNCALLVDCRAPRFNKWCTVDHVPASCSSPGEASIPVQDCDRDPALFVASLNKEVEPPPVPDRAPTHPDREVIAMLRDRTIVELPPGRTYASLDSTRVHSASLETVLRLHAVEIVSKAFPCFDLADTLCTRRGGGTVRCSDLSTHYVFLLPERGDPDALSADLEALLEVVFAEPNGYYVEPASSPSFSLPNPMRPGSEMALELPAATHVTLDIYSVAGRRVRRLEDATLPQGRHALVWDGKDDLGQGLPSGIYLVRLTGLGHGSTYKTVLWR